jgi:hypothetical protein
MFYIILWLTMFIGWIALIVYGAAMESRDRAAVIAERTGRQPRVTVVEEEDLRVQLAHG